MLLASSPALADSVRDAVARGNALFAEKKYQEAAVAYEAAGPTDRAPPELLYNLACARAALGEPDSAEQLLRRLDSSPSSRAVAAATRYNLGVLAYQRGEEAAKQDPAAAIDHLRRSERFFRAARDLDSTDRDAARNIEVVQGKLKELLDQQKQEEQQPQQQHGQQGQDQKEQEKREQQQGQQGEDQQQQDQQEQQPGQPSDSQQQQQERQQQNPNSQPGEQSPQDQQQQQPQRHPSDQQKQEQGQEQQGQQQQGQPKKQPSPAEEKPPQEQQEAPQVQAQESEAQQAQRDQQVLHLLEKERRERDAIRRYLQRMRERSGKPPAVKKDW
jgi:hypothetical protein